MPRFVGRIGIRCLLYYDGNTVMSWSNAYGSMQEVEAALLDGHALVIAFAPAGAHSRDYEAHTSRMVTND